jgi:inorganic pyrophosphatase
VQMVVETPRGSSIKYKYDLQKGIFTVSRSLALGVTYPFDWGFIPGTLSDDDDPVDALCLHHDASFPGVVLPTRCIAAVDVDQKGPNGRVINPRIILVPDWQSSGTAEAKTLSKRTKKRYRAVLSQCDAVYEQGGSRCRLAHARSRREFHSLQSLPEVRDLVAVLDFGSHLTPQLSGLRLARRRLAVSV